MNPTDSTQFVSQLTSYSQLEQLINIDKNTTPRPRRPPAPPNSDFTFNYRDLIMSTAFSNALSGLQANSEAINVVSGNLANENTYGYKANTVSFEELVSQIGASSTTNLTGAGVVPLSTQTFSQGSITTTGQPYDAAIQGNGFFVVQSSQGQQAFTRAGNFTLSATGQLLTQSGENVEGWNGLNGVVNTNSPLTNIVVPVAGLQAPYHNDGIQSQSEPEFGRRGRHRRRDVQFTHAGGRFARPDFTL